MNVSANHGEKPFNGRRLPIVFGILLSIAVFAVFSPLLQSEFINFDDPHYIHDNPRVRGGLTWPNVKWALTASHISNWHPLTWMSHMADCEIFGMRAGGHHFTSILWHALNSLLLFACLRRMTGAFWRSALVAWLFALHPLHVESVAWVAERKDVLSTFFGLLSLWFYIGFVNRRRDEKNPVRPAYLAALFAFALSLASKPMLVTFPFVLLLLDVWPLKRMSPAKAEKPGKGTATAWSALVLEKVPFLVLTVVSCIITFKSQNSGGAVQSIEKYTIGHRLANTCISYVRYLGKTFWPTDLAVFYPHEGWSSGIAISAFVLLLAVTVFAARSRNSCPFIGVGWFWFLGTLVPVIGIVQVGEQAMADRYSYWPLIGIFVAIVWLVHSKVKVSRHKPAFAVSVVIVLAFTFLTHVQAKHWRNSETLFTHALKATKDNYIAHNTLGLEHMGRNDMERAKFHFGEAIRIRHNYADPLCNLGSILAQEGNLPEAERLFKEALSAHPGFEQAHYNLGNLYRSKGDIEAARIQFLTVVKINPDNADAYSNLGMIAVQLSDMKMAASHFREVTRVKPRDPAAFFNLGLALANLGEASAAKQEFQNALKLRPHFPEAERELANLVEE